MRRIENGKYRAKNAADAWRYRYQERIRINNGNCHPQPSLTFESMTNLRFDQKDNLKDNLKDKPIININHGKSTRVTMIKKHVTFCETPEMIEDDYPRKIALYDII